MGYPHNTQCPKCQSWLTALLLSVSLAVYVILKHKISELVHSPTSFCEPAIPNMGGCLHVPRCIPMYMDLDGRWTTLDLTPD